MAVERAIALDMELAYTTKQAIRAHAVVGIIEDQI